MVRQRLSIYNCAVIHQTAGQGTEHGDVVNGLSKILPGLMGTGKHGAQLQGWVGLNVVSDSGSRVSSFVRLYVDVRAVYLGLRMEEILLLYPSPCRVRDLSATAVVKAPAMGPTPMAKTPRIIEL